MQAQRTESVADEQDRVDAGVLNLLRGGLEDQQLWSLDEVSREIGVDRCDTEDSLARLYGGGLVHRLEGFVFATRAAIKADELAI